MGFSPKRHERFSEAAASFPTRHSFVAAVVSVPVVLVSVVMAHRRGPEVKSK